MDKPEIKRKLFSWPSTILSVGWLALFSQTDTAAEMHGMISPVVEPITVTSVEPVEINGTPGSRIRGYAQILRDQCDYIDVEWQLVGERKSVNVTAFFADAAQVRETGVTQWEALMVGVPPHKLDETEGVARHECGRFPVMSPFFFPDDSIIPTDAGATALCHSGAYTTSTGPGTCSGHGGIKERFDQ